MWHDQCGIENVKTLKCFYSTEKEEMGWITLRRRIFLLRQNKHVFVLPVAAMCHPTQMLVPLYL